ncbi:NAD+ diphosphatase [Melampsora americana]|nr:NAD+ diphosphatase [Melampsora americana]
MDLAARNYYSGGFTNRLSWMRESPIFLRAALVSPKARFILFNALRPLVNTTPTSNASLELPNPFISRSDQIHSLVKISWKTLSAALGGAGIEVPVTPTQIIGEKGLMWPQQLIDRTPDTEHLPLTRYPTIIFLGADESRTEGLTLPLEPSKDSAQDVDQAFEDHTIGSPIWAIDVTEVPSLAHEGQITQIWQEEQDSLGSANAQSLKFIDLRTALLGLSDASIAAQSRSLIDWNIRNRFCSACGRPTHSEWVGWKLACTPDVKRPSDGHQDSNAPDLHTRAQCLTTKGGVQNFCYPRSDPVCIMAITNSTNDALLLGRKKIWPEGFYSCLAGFIEPGESLEDSVRREAWEEAGVKVGSVQYHSTQPWPFPGSLMIGVFGEAEANPKIRTDLDKELEDARFFPRSVVRKAVETREVITLTEAEIMQMDEGNSTSNMPSRKSIALKLRIPPPTAIAHQLIKTWALNDLATKPMPTISQRPNF